MYPCDITSFDIDVRQACKHCQLEFGFCPKRRDLLRKALISQPPIPEVQGFSKAKFIKLDIENVELFLHTYEDIRPDFSNRQDAIESAFELVMEEGELK